MSIATTSAASLMLALHLASAVHAQERYAIASAIGDRLAVVVERTDIGTNLDANLQRMIDLPEGGMDAQIMLRTERVLIQSCKTCSATFLKTAQYPEQDEARAQFVSALLAAAKQAGVDRLIVLTKHRADARLKIQDGSIGHGKLSGLGFFVDYRTRTQRTDTNERGTGYLGPFAYFRTQVFDVNTGAAVLEEASTASTSASAARSPDGDPWNAMTSQEKVNAVLGLVSRELARVLPAAVKKAN
jgi:hypothetical protein